MQASLPGNSGYCSLQLAYPFCVPEVRWCSWPPYFPLIFHEDAFVTYTLANGTHDTNPSSKLLAKMRMKAFWKKLFHTS